MEMDKVFTVKSRFFSLFPTKHETDKKGFSCFGKENEKMDKI